MRKITNQIKSIIVAMLLLNFIWACTEDEPEQDENNAPTIEDDIPDLALTSGFGTQTVALADVFTDADGDDLTLTATSSDEDVATVGISGTTLTLTEVGNGSTNVTVKAVDEEGESVSDSFTLKISEEGDTNNAPTVKNQISDQTFTEGFSAATVELANVFEDADVDELTLTATSEDETVVTVSISGTTLTITEVGIGTADVTVTAEDPSDASVSDTFSVTINESSETTIADFTFSNQDGNGLTIDSWTEINGVDGYAILINTEDSFTELTDGDDDDGSTSYQGVGQQLIYNGTSVSSLDISILESDMSYYFKLIPYTGNHVYDHQYDAEDGSTTSCETTSTTVSQVCFSIDGDVRTISSNQYPSHDVENFPNAEPTAIEDSHDFDLTPEDAGSITYVYDETGGPTPSNQNFWQFGTAVNGVEFHPMGLKPWENPDTGEENWEWQAKVTEEDETGLDKYGAHVTSAGNYHYHGDIVALADEEDGSRHSLIYGFAADGFPIYYKYGYIDADDPESGIKELKSSYKIKDGDRPGDGTTAPDGAYDGYYIQDYEYDSSIGDLDECNGRNGVTPEYPDGTYYYVITAEFPVTPNCFVGTPDESFLIGQ
ncbi:MAG: YHYH protein [Reichenbachiella sp.]|uniref:YHYH protein n=1 Tax=Reichenbachiella sp. TaxID=2184521 RepID=UPI003299A924